MTVIENGSFLVAVSEYGEFSSLLPLCREIETRLGLHPVIIFKPGYGLIKDHSQLVELENWSWTQLGSENDSFRTALDASSSNGYFRVFNENVLSEDSKVFKYKPTSIRVKLLCLEVLVFQILNSLKRRLFRKKSDQPSQGDSLLFPLKQLKQRIDHAERIFQKTQPKLVLSGQDYALSVTSIVSLVGERNGIRTVIVPFSMPPTTREIIESFAYHAHNRLKGMEKRLAQAVNPKWLNVRRGQVYCRVHLLAAIAADILELTPPEPWLPNSGRGIVFVPSQWAYEYYLKAGIPQSHLRLTGAPWSDILVKSASSVMERKSRLMGMIGQHGRRLIIISWPPNQYPRKALGCANYSDLCTQFVHVIQEIQNTGLASVAISLHPTLTSSKFLATLQNAGVHILRNSLLEYVDCADVFVSTVSSTSFWALQCGIPTINYDGYLYGYNEFAQAGAITIRTPAELLLECKKLFENPSYFNEVRTRILEQSSRFCEKGGVNTNRIIKGIAELAIVSEQGSVEREPIDAAGNDKNHSNKQINMAEIDGPDVA